MNEIFVPLTFKLIREGSAKKNKDDKREKTGNSFIRNKNTFFV